MSAWEVIYSVFFNTYKDFPFVIWVLTLLVVNFISGVLVALLPTNPERFKLGSLADWMLQAVIFIVGGGCISLVRVVVPAELKDYIVLVETLAWGSIIVALLGKIIANLVQIIPNGDKIPLPSWMGNKNLPETEAKP